MNVICFLPDFVLNNKYGNDYSRLHCDFISETCLTFDADLYVIGDIDCGFSGQNVRAKNLFTTSKKPVFIQDLNEVPGEKVMLEKTGEPIQNVDLSEIKTIIIGPDDRDFKNQYKKVTINTPKDYPLWSGVAAGIVLHTIQNK